MLQRRLSRSLSHKVLSYPVPNGLLVSTPSCHVTLTSRTWSSLLGMTRICIPVLLLKTWPGEKGWSRGMGRPLCSPLAVECRLPLLLMLLLSACSSTFLSTDRLSFSIQLSVGNKKTPTLLFYQLTLKGNFRAQTVSLTHVHSYWSSLLRQQCACFWPAPDVTE